MTSKCILSGPGHPHVNMALDEALLEAHRPGERTLRLYGWDPHALSLGYFQKAAEARETLASHPGLVLTRRPTGGGAIVDADDLTYALVADAPACAGASRDLYARMNRAIVEALRGMGVDAGERGGEPGARGSAFLCFERHADFDVTVGGGKIAGSAQRRKGAAVLQHGSILLKTPAPGGGGLTSVETLTGRAPAFEEASRLLADAARRAFDAPFPEGALPEAVRAEAKRLVETRYGTKGWIEKR